jgi:uncharacterized Fe-S cluster-containing radical SAM superfamily protein
MISTQTMLIDHITSDIMMIVQLKTMSDISMLTLLIRASATLINQDSNASIHGYTDMEYSKITSESPSDADFATLNCLNDILVQNHQILAAFYDDVITFTLVTSSSDS